MSALTNFTGPNTPQGNEQAQRAAQLAPFNVGQESAEGREAGSGLRDPKTASSMNALKHGFSSKKFIVMPGQEEDFETLKSGLLAEVRPEGALEENLFHQLLRDAWTMHRIELRQDEMAEFGTAQRAPSAPPDESEPRELSSRTAAPSCACTAQRASSAPPDESEPRGLSSRTAAPFCACYSKVDPLFDPACEKEFDRIERYHARAQSGFHRALRQLRTIQTNRIIQTVIPEPLGKGAFPALVKPTEIVTLAKRTHKYWNAMALNTLIGVSKRSREAFSTKKETTL